MYGQISTVAFVGIEAKPVEVQVRISGGQHVFAVVLTKHRNNHILRGWRPRHSAT